MVEVLAKIGEEMTWKELKDKAVELDVTDDFDVDIYHRNTEKRAGWQGVVKKAEMEVIDTPFGPNKEFQLFV